MDPAVAGAIGGGLVVLGLGLALAMFVYGRSTRDPELEALGEIVASLRETLDAERRAARVRAAGAAVDLGRAADLAGATAAGDIDGVLQQFPLDRPGAPASEPSRPPHARESSPDVEA